MRYICRMLSCVILFIAVHPPAAPSAGSAWESLLPVNADLNVEWVGETEAQGIKMRRLRYTGSLWKGEPQRVYALFAVPEGKGPFPAILQIHGGGQTCYPENVAYFVKQGYACLSFDWTGERENRPADQITHWSKDFASSYTSNEMLEPGRTIVAHAALAAMRGIDVLMEQPEVDKDRIGIQGISWGGFISWIVNGLDSRIKASASVYGIGGLDTQWSGIADSLASMLVELQACWRDNYDPYSHVKSLHAPVIFLNAANDFFGQMPEAEKLLAAVEIPHRRSYSPNRMHSLDPETVDAGLAWLACHLKGDGKFPEEPSVTFAIDAQGNPEAHVKADETFSIANVRVDFSRGSLPALIRAWESIPAVRQSDGTWKASIPVTDTALPLQVIAQVFYETQGMLSSKLEAVIPAMKFPEARATLSTTDILSDWSNGPSGWFIARGTEFSSADHPDASLETENLGGHDCVVYKTDEKPENIHIVSRLIADPSRNKGNQRSLEIWTHDLEKIALRTNWYLRQPGVRLHRCEVPGGTGWVRSQISLDQMIAWDEEKNETIPNGDKMLNWNDVRQLDITAHPTTNGKPAIGLIGWTD